MSRSDSLKKGKNNIELIVLSILRGTDCYGYQLTQLVNEYSEGLIAIPESSLYPALYRLLENGHISDYKKQVGKRLQRIYYHLEPSGMEYYKTSLDEYNRLNQGIANILNHSSKHIES